MWTSDKFCKNPLMVDRLSPMGLLLPIQPIGPGSKTIFCKLPRQNNRIYCHDSTCRSLFFIIYYLIRNTLCSSDSALLMITCCFIVPWEGATINYHLKKKNHKLILFYFSLHYIVHVFFLFLKNILILFFLFVVCFNFG